MYIRNIRKKIIAVVGVFIGSCSTAFALFPCFNLAMIPGYFYFGGMLGYQTIYSNSVHIVGFPNDNGIRFEAFYPEILIGYRNFFQDTAFFAGFEFFFSYRVGSIVNHTVDGNTFKNSYSFGPSLILGWAFDPQVLGYFRLGAINTQFTNPSANRWGYQLGVGVEFAFSPTWNLRGEYDFNKYGSIDSLGNPKADQYSIGLIYKFCGPPSQAGIPNPLNPS